MLIANVAEPVDLVLVLEQTEGNAMHGRIAPALVEEATRAIEMIEVVTILLAAPETQIADFEVGPEVAGRVSIRLFIVVWPSLVVLEPFTRIVGVYVVRMIVEELLGFWPERCYALSAVVDVDVEAVGLVVVLHPRKDVVVDVAEEVHVGFDSPVVLHVFQRWMLTEHAAIPPAHLMI